MRTATWIYALFSYAQVQICSFKTQPSFAISSTKERKTSLLTMHVCCPEHNPSWKAFYWCQRKKRVFSSFGSKAANSLLPKILLRVMPWHLRCHRKGKEKSQRLAAGSPSVAQTLSHKGCLTEAANYTERSQGREFRATSFGAWVEEEKEGEDVSGSNSAWTGKKKKLSIPYRVK